MGIFTHPTSYRLASAAMDHGSAHMKRIAGMASEVPILRDTAMVGLLNDHESHPDFGHLTMLVFSAVLEVVCVALPGYIVARRGMFDAEAQKMLANMNVQIFTPCLVFTKLASQLNADKLADLAVIPFIFTVQTLISWLCARIVAKGFGFGKRQTNFVVAMGVFGNSNSLPISLVLSLSKTLKGLHWDQVPGDNDNEVAARGILYLLIFQQLGQLVRWTWGYNVLLAPPPSEDSPDAIEGIARDSLAEQGRYRDDPDEDEEDTINKKAINANGEYASQSQSSSSSTVDDSVDRAMDGEVLPTPTNGNVVGAGPGNMAGNTNDDSNSQITTFPTYDSSVHQSASSKTGIKAAYQRTMAAISRFFARIGHSISAFSSRQFHNLPTGVQKYLSLFYHKLAKFLNGVWEFMNPPLWAMLIALVVASIPQLQALFFEQGSFVKNSVTRAIEQSGGVAVPLILVVLGANLARNTLPADQLAEQTPEGIREERNLLIASLVSRMLLPTVIMAPLLAIIAKFVPVSILDDPIFVIVCFLLTGAPSALQLAQICQINGVFMGAMSRLLFQSYVVWILPSTLVLVMLALEVVEWAAASG